MTHNDPTAVKAAKALVLELCENFDKAEPDAQVSVLSQYTSDTYLWRGLHPFNEQQGARSVCDVFWKPLRESFTALQRRVDIFFASPSSIPFADNVQHQVSPEEQASSVWTCQMGHFMGLMDKPWLDIPPTRRMVFVRFAEFHRVCDGVIKESALFIDLINVMRQAGHYPLPPITGASFMYPGPATSDGRLIDTQPAEQGRSTLAQINRMISDLSKANEESVRTGNNNVPDDVLATHWDKNMIWYGPDGIGATYTIERYRQQHQNAFRLHLSGKTFNGHVARFAEGHYGCFFGWPNLTNTAEGGFLGLPGSNRPADMRVTDVYRSDGNKLVENWVIIDLPHWLMMQGLDVLKRMRQLLGVESL